MAEAHPVAFQWVMEAKKRGATLIHIDPRFTRTSANSDRHIPLRSGSDVILLGAVIKHILDNDLWFEEYVRTFTNISTIISEKFLDAEDGEGVFSGFDPESGSYDLGTWAYEGAEDQLNRGLPERDETLQHPRCVYQILKRHYARYTPEMVEEYCGIPREDFDYLVEKIVENSGRERTTCFAYALGWTQQQGGSQMIRTSAVLQLLMGNVGRPGSGIMAMRGHANIQGGTDLPTLFHILPGYLPMPKAGQEDFDKYARGIGKKEQKGFWANADIYAANLLKAWWGEKATPDNGFCFDYLPRLTGAHSTYQTLQLMLEKKVDGYFILGQNPAVGSANGRMQRQGMSNLKWLVVRDYYMIESASWWKDGPEIESGEVRSEDIGTEVFYLPCANHMEKAGSFTQTQRMVQWRDQGALPPDDATSELQFIYELGQRVREKLKDSTDERDRPLLELTWDYPVDEHGEPDAEAVLMEINGRYLTGEKAGQPLPAFAEMKADGSTEGGCWIYTGVFKDGVNQAKKRVSRTEQGPTALDWGWAWPANRRILYNRASADAQGRPWSERKKHVWWDEEQGKWVGNDVPDFPVAKRPDDPGDPTKGGAAALAGTDAFIMQSDGRGWLFAPSGLADGPLPTHYEGPESRVENPLYRQQHTPTGIHPQYKKENLNAPGIQAGGDVYPYVFTTYRITEHHTAGGMSRFLPYLAELQPELYAEVSPELAQELGLEHNGWMTIISPRSAIEARVMVTERMTPLEIGGRTIHTIGLPYHWARGKEAVVSGDGVNDLIGMNLDANTQIQNSKNNQCAIRAGRRPHGEELRALVREYQERAGIVTAEGGVREYDPQQARNAVAIDREGHQESSVPVAGETEGGGPHTVTKDTESKEKSVS